MAGADGSWTRASGRDGMTARLFTCSRAAIRGITVGDRSEAVRADGCVQGRAVMDPVSLAFGAALVGAIATDEWPRVREAVVGLWRRLRPKQQADDVEAELCELREQVLAARRDKDVGTEKALEGAWQVKAHQLVRADASVAE